MSLNIKNERVHALVREAAQRTGMSQTSVVEEALRRMLRDLDAKPEIRVDLQREQIAVILADLDARLTPETRLLLSTDDLYDDAGLPA
ncbi:type II toxin-antitoxin system VapB family antitoxin [Nocardia sp. NBC_01503]|uniref:type II toxin-antitoxin system VapB family antitoxin n=1 Tax=Nocardia sp. NBC_01503 TaxID=2975997 RepID=UPI002E7BA4C4|nr:type II toxin-antitoxin system VapB family antitoxin [Nocardia sp. NBC_01503]WTL36000.1 type II toxin-antitoxin system VapB family antitoxin [Nocardia sp. NBC_01503]